LSNNTRYKIASGHRQDFEQAYSRAQESLRTSPYCDAYELTHCHEERERYVLRIVWTSIEDHEQRFRHDPSFKDFLALVKPFIPKYRRNATFRTHERRRRRPRRSPRSLKKNTEFKIPHTSLVVEYARPILRDLAGLIRGSLP